MPVVVVGELTRGAYWSKKSSGPARRARKRGRFATWSKVRVPYDQITMEVHHVPGAERRAMHHLDEGGVPAGVTLAPLRPAPIDRRRLALPDAARTHPLHAPLWRFPGVDRDGGHIRPRGPLTPDVSAAPARRGKALPRRNPDRYLASGSDRRHADRADANAATGDHGRRELEAWDERSRPTRPRLRGARDVRPAHDLLRALELGAGQVPREVASLRGPRAIHPVLLHASGAGAGPPGPR